MPEGSPSDPHRGMNTLERDFALELEANGILYKFNEIRLKLGEGAWYKPDFFAWKDGKIAIYETKGFQREAAQVRVKVAASRFPMWPFFRVRRIDGAWVYEEIKI
jgi:hypothetical protein